MNNIVVWDSSDPQLKKLEGKPGVYILYLQTICLYVGASENLKQRVTNYLKGNGNGGYLLNILISQYRNVYPAFRIYVRIVPCKKSQLKLMEQVYVKQFKPLFNRSKRYYQNCWDRLPTLQEVKQEVSKPGWAKKVAKRMIKDGTAKQITEVIPGGEKEKFNG